MIKEPIMEIVTPDVKSKIIITSLSQHCTSEICLFLRMCVCSINKSSCPRNNNKQLTIGQTPTVCSDLVGKRELRPQLSPYLRHTRSFVISYKQKLCLDTFDPCKLINFPQFNP